MKWSALALAIATLLSANSVFSATRDVSENVTLEAELSSLSGVSAILAQQHDALFDSIGQLDQVPSGVSNRVQQSPPPLPPALSMAEPAPNITDAQQQQLIQAQREARALRARITSYQQTIQQLSEQIATLQQQPAVTIEPAHPLDILLQGAASMGERVAGLWEDLRKGQRGGEAQVNDQQVERLTNETRQLQQQLASAENNIQVLREQRLEANAEREKLTEQLRVQQQQLAAVDAPLQEQTQRAQAAEIARQQLATEIEVLEQRLATAEQTGEEQAQRLPLLEVERQKLVTQVETLQQQLSVAEQAAKELAQQLPQAEQKLLAQLETLQQQLNAAEKQATEQAQRLPQAEAERQKLLAQLETLQQQLASAATLTKEQAQQLQQAETARLKLVTQAEAQQQQQMTLAEQTGKEQALRLQQAEAERQKLTAKFEAQQQQLAAAEKANQEQTLRIEQAEAERQKLANQLETQQQQLTVAEKSSKDQTQQIAQAEVERQKLANQLETQQQQLVAAEKSGKEQTQQIAQAEVERQKLANQLETQQQQLVAAEKSGKEQTQLIAQAETERQKLATQVETLQASNKTTREKPKTLAEQQAYANGVLFAKQLNEITRQQQQIGLSLDSNFLLRGLNDGVNNQIVMNNNEISVALSSFNQRTDKKLTELARQTEKNGDSFISEFNKKKDVKQHAGAGGFSYQIVRAGNKKRVGAGSQLRLELKESLPGGIIVSDTSALQGGPITLNFDELPPLLQESLKLIGEGGEVKSVVAAYKIYGDEGALPLVSPKSTLIYDIKLLGVLKP